MTGNEIRKTIEIDASPETVFKALSDPKELTNWFPDAVTFEPRAGGKFKFSFYKDSARACGNRDGNSFNEGKILEFVPNKKLAYTWKWVDTPNFPETIVTWELEQMGPNKTRLKLTHSGFTGKEPSNKSFQDHNEGWSMHLNLLAEYYKK
ncbi:hypothetical protein DYY66_1618 [Candidatus Nitrosotalea sp. FS]|uniref:SRPBCC family protein n=1 Tax=Candidatus Nitrosotalea sp. FS TaxID=2341021 RepID=UPI00140D7035|nr:SRPBCC domain-containing protein [Candidatus Nitrosotalea sp. FS]NHH98716.1 hypothetical protein [Candidatus Nitrosotalea sp. FS]